MNWYGLDENKNPVLLESIEEVIKHKSRSDCLTGHKVASTNINGHRVSTVFLGLDHNYTGRGPPVLFETMIFGPDSLAETDMWRYCTWDEAEAGHKNAVRVLEERLNTSPEEKLASFRVRRIDD